MGDSGFVVEHEKQLLGPFVPDGATQFTATRRSPFENIWQRMKTHESDGARLWHPE